MEKVYLGVENATLATDIEFGAKVTAGFVNESGTNVSMVESHSFIFTPYAYAISGVFVWSALFLACFFIFQHLRYYAVPEQQLWIVRIFFIIPIYGLCSWLGLILPEYSVYFDAVRSCYEAFVIYNFLRLCLAYLGGETAILAQINGKPIQRSVWDGTCCLPRLSYSIRILRFCKQATLQFCIVKPIVAAATIILEATGAYHEGDLSPRYGYFYCTLAYNLSITVALYGLILFYSSTRELLSKYNPVLKFLTIKSIVFLSFWQGLLLTILQWFNVLKDPIKGASVQAAAYQNFLITVEMLFAVVLLRFAFPYKPYMDLRKDDQGRGVPMKKITSHFRDTLNPHDVVDDAIHNFSRVYQKYAQQGDLSEDEIDHGTPEGTSNSRSTLSLSNSDEDNTGVKRHSPNLVQKMVLGTKGVSSSSERRTLLVESDEDEIL